MAGFTQIIKGFRWPQWLILAGFLIVSCLTALTIYYTIGHARSWRHHHDEPIHGWMTVGYVAHTYHVPPRILYDALGLPGDRFDRRPLKEIAREQNRSMDQIRGVLEDAIVRFGSPHFSATPIPPEQFQHRPADSRGGPRQ
ncbi:MAG TPA: hypothetical protein VI756_02790 [Blastocatellia bacterium]